MRTITLIAALFWSGFSLLAQIEKKVNYTATQIDASTILMAGQAQISARNAAYFQIDG